MVVENESQVGKEEQYTDVLSQYRNNTWNIIYQRLYYQRVGHASILVEREIEGATKQVLYIFGGSVRDQLGNPV